MGPVCKVSMLYCLGEAVEKEKGDVGGRGRSSISILQKAQDVNIPLASKINCCQDLCRNLQYCSD